MVKDRKKYLKEYDQIYSRRPDVIKRKKERRARPEVKARRKEYDIEYNKRPEVIERVKTNNEYRKEYYQKNKERIKKRVKDYAKNNPDIKILKREYHQRPEIKTRMKEYRQTQEYKAHRREYKEQPINIIKDRLLNRFLIIAKRATTFNINYSAILQYLKPFPQNLDLHVIHHKIPLNRFKFFNPDGTIIKEDFEKAFAPDNHEWMTIEAHKKLDHSKL